MHGTVPLYVFPKFPVRKRKAADGVSEHIVCQSFVLHSRRVAIQIGEAKVLAVVQLVVREEHPEITFPPHPQLIGGLQAFVKFLRTPIPVFSGKFPGTKGVQALVELLQKKQTLLYNPRLFLHYYHHKL